MANISRTYPLPDQSQLTPRERAMAVYRLLFGMEPDAAIAHADFERIANSFVVAGDTGWNMAIADRVAYENGSVDSPPILRLLQPLPE